MDDQDLKDGLSTMPSGLGSSDGLKLSQWHQRWQNPDSTVASSLFGLLCTARRISDQFQGQGSGQDVPADPLLDLNEDEENALEYPEDPEDAQ